MSWRRLAFVLVVCGVGYSSLSQGQDQTQTVRYKEVQSLKIVGPVVNVTVEAIPGAKETLVRSSALFPMGMTDGVLQLEPNAPIEIHVRGPSTPLVIYAERGNVKLNRWASPANIGGGELNVITQFTAAEMWIQTHGGMIRFTQHNGPLDLDTYSGRVELSKIEGDVKLTNFIGESHIEGLKGQLALDAYSGKVHVTGSEGHLLMRGARAPIRIAGHKGSIEGKVQEGALTIELAESEPSIRVESTTGPLQVRVPASIGAQVYVSSNEGAVNVPAGITTQTTARGRVGWGRIRGSAGGRIHLKSESGDIRIR